MLLREKVLKSFQKQGLLLEAHHTDGMLSKIVNDVKESLKEFGNLLGASAKLIMTDITHLSAIIFGRPKSLEEYQQMRERVKARKTQHWTQISGSVKKLNSNFPEGKIILETDAAFETYMLLEKKELATSN